MNQRITIKIKKKSIEEILHKFSEEEKGNSVFWKKSPSTAPYHCTFFYMKSGLVISDKQSGKIDFLLAADIDNILINPKYNMTAYLKNGDVVQIIA